RFGPDWWPLEFPRHLLHFNSKTLCRLVEDHGLEVSEVRMLARASWMRRSFDIWRRQKRAPKGRWLSLVGKFRSLRSWLTRWTVWKNQADCVFVLARRPLNQLARAAA